MRLVILALAAFVLSNCVTDSERVWTRLDGQAVSSRPELASAFEIDHAVCRGEMAKADTASSAPPGRRLQADQEIMDGCMAQRGYRLVPR